MVTARLGGYGGGWTCAVRPGGGCEPGAGRAGRQRVGRQREGGRRQWKGQWRGPAATPFSGALDVPETGPAGAGGDKRTPRHAAPPHDWHDTADSVRLRLA